MFMVTFRHDDDDDEYYAGELQTASGVQLCLLAILCQVIVGADRFVKTITKSQTICFALDKLSFFCS